MKFKIYKYNDIDGNILFKLVKGFKFDFSSVKNFFLSIVDRIIVGPNTYMGGGSHPMWWNGKENFIKECDGKLNTHEYPRIDELDDALDICRKYYTSAEKEKLVNKKIKLVMKPMEVQIIKGKDIITGDKNEV